MHRGDKSTMLALVLIVSLIGCTDNDDKTSGDPSPAASAPEAATSVADPALSVEPDHFVLTQTSWGAAPQDSESKKPEAPPIVISWDEGQRQKFEREAKKRWKNTEIFVRRDR